MCLGNTKESKRQVYRQIQKHCQLRGGGLRRSSLVLLIQVLSTLHTRLQVGTATRAIMARVGMLNPCGS